MDDANQPPPSTTLLAAAAGAFGGALLGAVAATSLMGDSGGDSANGQAAIDAPESQVVEMVAAEG